MSDEIHMAHALRLAARGLGAVWPNPAVGCVLVRDGQIVGRGWTQPGGRPHAETRALAQAGAEIVRQSEPGEHNGRYLRMVVEIDAKALPAIARQW